MPSIIFEVEGPPVAKARPRVINRSAYTPAKTKDYEERVRGEALREMLNRGLEVVRRPQEIDVELVFEMPMPASWSAKKRGRLHLTGHAQAPDLDNLVKAILDGCKGVVYEDDSQITGLSAGKVWVNGRGNARVTVMWDSRSGV